MQNNFLIRTAKLADVPDLAAIHVRTWQTAYAGLMPQDFLDSLSIEKRTQGWQENLTKEINKQEQRRTFVAEVDGEIVGFCSGGWNRDEDAKKDWGEVWAIYISSEASRQGIGAKLLTEVEQYLKQQGFSRATLWVLDSNKIGRNFYEKMGWQMDGKTKIDSRDGFDLNEVRYFKLL